MKYLETFIACTILVASISASYVTFSKTKYAIVDKPLIQQEVVGPELLTQENCPHKFTEAQAENLRLAYKKGVEVGYPETIQAIMLVESEAGLGGSVGNLTAPVGERVYGLMQLKVVAAREIFNRYPDVKQKYFPEDVGRKLYDEEIIALLLTNKEANVEIGALNFHIMMKSTKDWRRAVTAYYTGLQGLKNNNPSYGYTDKVRSSLQKVKPLNACVFV